MTTTTTMNNHNSIMKKRMSNQECFFTTAKCTLLAPSERGGWGEQKCRLRLLIRSLLPATSFPNSPDCSFHTTAFVPQSPAVFFLLLIPQPLKTVFVSLGYSSLRNLLFPVCHLRPVHYPRQRAVLVHCVRKKRESKWWHGSPSRDRCFPRGGAVKFADWYDDCVLWV